MKPFMGETGALQLSSLVILGLPLCWLLLLFVVGRDITEMTGGGGGVWSMLVYILIKHAESHTSVGAHGRERNKEVKLDFLSLYSIKRTTSTVGIHYSVNTNLLYILFAY